MLYVSSYQFTAYWLFNLLPAKANQQNKTNKPTQNKTKYTNKKACIKTEGIWSEHYLLLYTRTHSLHATIAASLKVHSQQCGTGTWCCPLCHLAHTQVLKTGASFRRAQELQVAHHQLSDTVPEMVWQKEMEIYTSFFFSSSRESDVNSVLHRHQTQTMCTEFNSCVCVCVCVYVRARVCACVGACGHVCVNACMHALGTVPHDKILYCINILIIPNYNHYNSGYRIVLHMNHLLSLSTSSLITCQQLEICCTTVRHPQDQAHLNHWQNMDAGGGGKGGAGGGGKGGGSRPCWDPHI